MPSFLKDLRRFSRTSFRADKPPDTPSADSSDAAHSNQSSSTLNTSGPDSSTPPSTIPSEKSASIPSITTNGAPPIPSRPPSFNNRYSIVNRSGSTLANLSRAQGPASPYAPRVLSISENSWVHQKVLLIHGQIADPAQQAFDGTIWVCHHQDSFPATQWPVSDSYFKALVHLQPGPNRLRLDFVSQKLQAPSGSAAHSTWININYLPSEAQPPLDLVILLGKDSPGTFDAVPERKQREGNGLDVAIKKYKMAAYLWQAFTGEQMNRNSFGRRCFRLEEQWQPGSLSWHDQATHQLRNEAKVHVVRTNKTVAELRDLELAQQYESAAKKGELFTIAQEAVKGYFQIPPNQTRYVSVLLLDTHWDPTVKTIRGHAALGGGDGSLRMAIFGSHALQTYPSCFEEVVPAFTDCTRTDTSFVANDCNDSGSNWEAANIGIGAHLHEVGHLFGCPHQESGLMLRDYVRLNRTFTCREPFSTRTKSPGQRLCLQADECTWHRLDCLRFRFHPCFRLPSDPPLAPDESIQVWAVENGNILITAATGIAWIELYPESITECKHYIEYIDPNGSSPLPRQVVLSESDVRNRLPNHLQKKPLKIEIFSAGQGKYAVQDFEQLVSKSNRLKLGNGQFGFRGSKLGYSQMDGSQSQELILSSALDQRKVLKQIKVFHGMALDGVEFIYEDSSSQLFGKRGGQRGGTDFYLDIRKGETIIGFYVRAGLWIDGLQILTSQGRRSELFGNAEGGSGYTLLPPRGYSFAGIAGSVAQWVDGFSLIITR